MPEFVQLRPNIDRLCIPFGGTWTGVFLIHGEQNVLIDSGGEAAHADQWIVPALKEMGMDLSQISYLACTHCHGDHVGSHARLKALCPGLKIACFEGSRDKIRDPLHYSKLIRARFPAFSPQAPKGLTGAESDVLLQDGQCLTPFLRLLHTPGHDTDSVCWLDERTNTLIAGDSLQLNGTVSQGTALVMDLPGYLQSLKKLKELPVDCILTGHDFLPLGPEAEGHGAVREYLDACEQYLADYGAFLESAWQAGDHDPASLTQKLIRHMGCVMPEYLFLPLYTVSEILKSKQLEGVLS